MEETTHVPDAPFFKSLMTHATVQVIGRAPRVETQNLVFHRDAATLRQLKMGGEG